MLKYIVIILALFSSVAFGRLPDPKDNVTEAKSVDRDRCVDGSCDASSYNVRLTENRVEDAETARRLAMEAKGKTPPKMNSGRTSK